MIEFYGCEAAEDGGCFLYFSYSENHKKCVWPVKLSRESIMLYDDAIELALYAIEYRYKQFVGGHR